MFTSTGLCEVGCKLERRRASKARLLLAGSASKAGLSGWESSTIRQGIAGWGRLDSRSLPLGSMRQGKDIKAQRIGSLVRQKQ